MKSSEKFSISKRIKSFKYAFNGLQNIVLKEHNFRIHLLAAASALLAGVFFNISNTEWLAIIIIITLVLSLEIINSVVEKLSDIISPKKNNKIKIIKNMSAGAVLLAALTSLIIAGIIFIPKIDY